MLTESVCDGLRLFIDDDLRADGFLVAFTTRLGDKGQANHVGLDLSPQSRASSARPEAGRLLVAGALGLSPQSLTFAEQVHGDRVSLVGESDIGAGSIPLKPLVVQSDALVTVEKGASLVILTADCVPIALVDRQARVVGAVHAGWRGTFAKIVVGAVEAMVRLGARSTRIEARIGPAIGPCCYDVSPELFKRFTERFHVSLPGDNSLKLDLRNINQQTLVDVGVRPENIEDIGFCTSCEDEMFYSWRSRRDAGRQGLIVARLT